MFRLMRYLKPYTLGIILLIGLVVVQVLANLQLPDYLKKIIDEGISQSDTAKVWHYGLLMIGFAFSGVICSSIVGYLASRISSSYARDLRDKVFTRVENFSLVEFDKFSTASLITRSTNDVQQVQMVWGMLLRIAVMAPVMGVVATIKANGIGSQMSWIMVLAVSAILLLILILFFVALPKFKSLQKLLDRLNLVVRERLTGLRVIRAFNTQKLENKKFDKANWDLVSANLFVNRAMLIMQTVVMMLFSLVSVLIVAVGAKYINAGTMQIGGIMAFMQYAMQVIFSFIMITMMFIMVPRSSVCAQRIDEVLKTKPVILDPEQAKSQQENEKGKIVFENVSFSYPGAELPVLQDINFTVESGQTTAIIGGTGSGKSTTINLIPRFYDVTKGSVLVGGVDVRDQNQEDLCAGIGYVPQKAVLFKGTVASNLRYGKVDSSIEQVQRAAEVAQASEFIEKMEGQYDAEIAQDGHNVSGGQKQRLSIARAVNRDPEIYIFDDCFSAVDYQTDARLRKALGEYTKKATVLIVAQRINTIRNAQKIIVLDEGKIVGTGTHADLMQNCPVYREIALSQLSEEELA